MTVLHPVYFRKPVSANLPTPLRVAVIGAGPAGFYAVEELLKQTDLPVAVDLFDRLPTPYGLVRGGVAPDHQKIKAVTRQYEKIAQRPGFRFFGNVSFGRDLTLDELLAHYHHALFATGAESDRRMGIPGEDLLGSFPATIFVAWYNGHPDFQDLRFDLSSTESVAIVGNGNVAIDVARILSRPVDELAKTDIAEHTIEALRQSAVKNIYVLGRRGPAQAAFTNPELRELTELPGVDLVVRPEDMALDPLSDEFLAQQSEPMSQRNLETLTGQLVKGEGTQARKIRLHFLVSPVMVLGTERVEGVRIEKNRLVKDEHGNLKAQGTGEYQDLPCQMIFRSIGYKGHRLAGVPFDERAGVIPNSNGRVLDLTSGLPVPRLYVAGWIKRGPSGVIGTNKADASATVAALLADVRQGMVAPEVTTDAEAIPTLLTSKQVQYVTFAGWQRIDQHELSRGQEQGKVRNKLVTRDQLLESAEAA
ncbi:MAG: NADP oxidoreductase [Deltaproteobacteria bacterium]|nr:NADP oxidoreductase [Deltaproteobacteria bacterium]